MDVAYPSYDLIVAGPLDQKLIPVHAPAALSERRRSRTGSIVGTSAFTNQPHGKNGGGYRKGAMAGMLAGHRTTPRQEQRVNGFVVQG